MLSIAVMTLIFNRSKDIVELPPEDLKDTWMTPPHILRLVKLLAGGDITFDLACSVENRVCPDGYTREENSLAQPWDCLSHAWCNPPYSNIPPWVDKAAASRDSVISMLVPASTDTKWFYKATLSCAEWYLFNGRIQFLPPKGLKKSTARGNNVLFIFNTSIPKEHLGDPLLSFRGFLDAREPKTCET